MGLLNEVIGAVVAEEALSKADTDAGFLKKAMAAVAGFLLTAVPEFTGCPGASPARILALTHGTGASTAQTVLIALLGMQGSVGLILLARYLTARAR